MLTKAPADVTEAAENLLAPKHYFVLLGSLLGLTVVGPVVGHILLARFMIGLFGAMSLLSAALATESKKGPWAIGAFLFTGLAAVAWLLASFEKTYPFNTVAFQLLSYALTLGFFATTCGIILRDVCTGRVTANRICGAVCVYILIGFCFAVVHMMVVIVDPHAYKGLSDYLQQNTPALLPRFERFRIFVYYSFCTISTVGYGDIVPVSLIARSLSWWEAVCGQMYLTVLVARLVGLHIAESTMRGGKHNQSD